jgi:hypothetical protein
MPENSDTPRIETTSETFFSSESISRRELSKRLVKLTAALSLAGSHPAWGGLTASGVSDAADANWKPLFLATNYEAVESLAEAIIPGSTNASVARFMDLLLSVDNPVGQNKFLEALSAIQAESNQRFNAPFQTLSAAQRDSLLTAVSTAPEGSALLSSFLKLRGWIADCYYSSEMGMMELGWTHNMFFRSMHSCTLPEANL